MIPSPYTTPLPHSINLRPGLPLPTGPVAITPPVPRNHLLGLFPVYFARRQHHAQHIHIEEGKQPCNASDVINSPLHICLPRPKRHLHRPPPPPPRRHRPTLTTTTATTTTSSSSNNNAPPTVPPSNRPTYPNPILSLPLPDRASAVHHQPATPPRPSLRISLLLRLYPPPIRRGRGAPTGEVIAVAIAIAVAMGIAAGGEGGAGGARGGRGVGDGGLGEVADRVGLGGGV